jgi:MoaA/NifB/PqqE/SkfB family radical SAM enzyme
VPRSEARRREPRIPGAQKSLHLLAAAAMAVVAIAGRGFFHINPYGKAEPCPFSPYSDTDLRTTSIRQALKSPLFQKLKDSNMLFKEHDGGCVLFEQEDEVKKISKV